MTATKLHLTPRQSQILGKVSQGMGLQQIADDLKLSPRTIAVHVARMKQDADAFTLNEVVFRAARDGLI